MSESTQDDLDRAWLALPEELRRKIDDESDIYHEASAEQAASRVALWAEKRLAEMTASRDVFRELARRTKEEAGRKAARRIRKEIQGEVFRQLKTLQRYDGVKLDEDGRWLGNADGNWVDHDDIITLMEYWE